MSNEFIQALNGLTERVVAYRKFVRKQRMSRLSDKLTKAAGVVQRQTAQIEARADALIEREAIIQKRTHEVFTPHESLLTEAEKGLDEVEKQLALLSNDPLAVSTNILGEPPKQHPPGMTRGSY